MSRRQRQMRALVILLVVVLLLAGAVVLAQQLTGSTEEAAPAPASPSAAPEASVVEQPPVLPPGSVEGLVNAVSSTASGDDQRYASTLEIPSVPGFGEVERAVLDQQLDAYEQALADAPDGRGSFDVASDVVVAAGPYLGLRTEIFASVGGGNGIVTTTTTWVDTQRPSVILSPDLIADPQRDALRALVLAAIERDRPEALVRADPPLQFADDDLLLDLRFADDGALLVVVGEDSGAIVSAAGPQTVRVEPAAAERLLTADARRIAAAVAADESAVPLPAPEGDDAWKLPEQRAEGVDCSVERCIALTFDDGPSQYTDRLLGELAEADARATFMVVGRNAATQPATVERAAEAGHQIVGHTWSHPDLTTLDDAGILDEIERTDAAIEAATGEPASALMRPPYGAVDDRVLGVLAGAGKAAVLWNVDTEDWRNRDVAETTRRAVEGAKPGAIVLMHDIHESTVDAVPGIVEQLRAAGYTLVTVDELLGATTPGAEYFHRP